MDNSIGQQNNNVNISREVSTYVEKIVINRLLEELTDEQTTMEGLTYVGALRDMLRGVGLL